jgi:uncharacterized surface anchored protein
MTPSPLPRPGRAKKVRILLRNPSLEALEDRWLPSTISGFVYNDLNGDGIQDNNEPGIPNAHVTLVNSQNQSLGTVTTDSNGFYEFNTDPTQQVAPKTITQTANFNGTTDYTQNGTINQFDPSLGQLTSVQITFDGTLQTDMKVQNLDALTQTITQTVNGDMKLQVGNITNPLEVGVTASQTKQLAGSDGTIDTTFSGPSSADSGQQSSDQTKTLTLTAGTDDLSAFLGTGTVKLTDTATATSSSTGSGNLLSLIQTSALGKVTITYTYTPATGLQAGTYTITEDAPPGYSEGYLTQGNVNKIPGSVGNDTLTVTVDGTNNSTLNNFGEVQTSSLAGFVYHDHNDNGVRDPGDEGLSGVTVRLIGTDFAGNSVQTDVVSGTDGSYSFTGLLPGTYNIVQLTQPPGFLDGLSTAGSLGGAAAQDQILNIALNGNQQGTEYDFGHFKGGSLSGFVYADTNNNGVRDSGETGLGGSVIALTGQTNSGQAVSLSTTTAGDGSYSFTGLLPGTYNIVQMTQPTGYIAGQDAVGTQGGVLGTNSINQAVVLSGTNGTENDFGEILPPVNNPPPDTFPPPTNNPPPTASNPPPTDTTPPPDDTFSKRLFLWI